MGITLKTLARIAELMAWEKDYNAQVKAWKEEREALVRTLDLGLIAEDDLVAEVKETKRFNADLAKKMLSPELYNAILVEAPNAALAKKVLTGFEYEDCQKVSGKTIVFRRD